MTKTPKRPRDPSQLAKFVIDAATGEAEAIEDSPEQTRASKGGTAGGPARARVLTPAQRSEIARVAAEARWKKN
ncbi:MAG: histone H1 [Methylocella sp.]